MQQEDDAALVTFEQGSAERFDLVVAADGIGSDTRRLVFDDEPVVKSLGVEATWATIARTVSDTDWWRWFITPGGTISLRPDRHGTTGAGWKADRVLEALEDVEDLYFEVVGHVHAPLWSKGPVVLLGDAAYCPSPVTGMGTTLAVAGAYVLAGAMAKHTALRDGLTGYERIMRPWVNQAQKLPPGVPRIANPTSRAGVALLQAAVRVAGTPAVRRTAARLSRGRRPTETFTLPGYAHLRSP